MSDFRLRCSLATAALAAGLAAAPQGPAAAAGRSLAELFPSDTYAVVEFAGLDACRAAAGRQGLFRFVEERAAAFYGTSAVAHHAPNILGDIDRALGEVGLSRRDVLPVLRAPIALGVSRVTFFDNDAIPSVALVFAAGGDRAQPAARLVDLFIEMMMQEAPDPEMERVDVAGSALRVVRSGRSNGAIAAGIIGDHAVLTSNPRFAMEIARTAAGKRESFADVADFGVAATDAAEWLLRARLNVGPLWDGLRLVLPYEADAILDALGVSRVNGLEITLSGIEDGGRERLFLSADHRDDGLVGRLVPSGTAANAARFFPKSTLLFGSTSCDFGGLAGSFMRLVEAFPTELREELRDEVMGEMTEEFRREGLPLRVIKDALLGVGPELSFAVEAPLQGGLLPTILIAAQLRRGGGAGWLTQRLVDFGLEPRSVEFENRTLHYVSIDTGGGPTVAPAFAEVDGMLLFGSTLGALKTAIRDAGGDTSLGAQADFTAVLGAHAGAASIGVLRVDANAAAYWDAYGRIVENLVESMPPDAGITGDMLPTSEDLERMLRDHVLTVRRDQRGIQFTSQGSVSAAAVLAAAGCWLDQLLAHGLDQRREN